MKIISLHKWFGVALIATSAAGAFAQYSVKDKWKLGGEGGWDYLIVDAPSHLLYITRGDRVMVVDTQTGKQSGEITGLKGTHGVAFDDTGKYGYISDGRGNSVAVFDRATRKIVQTIEAGTNPDGILYEPVTREVMAFNGSSKNATVIDTATNKVIATIPLPGKPEFPAADGKGTVFVNIEDTNQIVRIDAKSLKATATWSVAPCESPSGLAIDTENRRLFAVCDGKKMAVVDADSGKVVATPEIGDGPDAAGFDAKSKLAFSSNGEGSLTIVHQDSKDKYSVLQTVATQRSGRTMALDPSNGTVYVVAAEFGPRPAATAANPRPRPSLVPGSFTVLVVGK